MHAACDGRRETNNMTKSRELINPVERMSQDLAAGRGTCITVRYQQNTRVKANSICNTIFP